ncbi:MAG: hypothetical protein OXI81_08420 [Paracoccaceae bacterium]|nr:hypothetical protein [Paracoccaceae bacterium]
MMLAQGDLVRFGRIIDEIKQRPVAGSEFEPEVIRPGDGKINAASRSPEFPRRNPKPCPNQMDGNTFLGTG